MPDFEERKQDLGDYGATDATDSEEWQVIDPAETLEGDPGDDPLDTGVIAPDRWSAGLRQVVTGDQDTESLEQQLAEEEPDIGAGPGDTGTEDTGPTDDTGPGDTWDENATGSDVTRYERNDDADPRAGRLVAEDEQPDEDREASPSSEDRFSARDAGIDGGAATAEEAAVHVQDDPETDE
jgi:hypothetical protein